MSDDTTAPPSAAQRLTGSLARAGFNLLDAHATAIEQFVDQHDGALIDEMIGFLDSHFDRSTMQARVAEGPILGTLRNMKPDIVADISAALEAGFGALETQLAAVAKADGA